MGMSQLIYVLRKTDEDTIKKTLMGALIYKVWEETHKTGHFVDNYLEEMESIIGLNSSYVLDELSWGYTPDLYEIADFGKNEFTYNTIKEELNLTNNLEYGKYYELSIDKLKSIYKKLKEQVVNSGNDYADRVNLSQFEDLMNIVDEEGDRNYYLYTLN